MLHKAIIQSTLGEPLGINGRPSRTNEALLITNAHFSPIVNSIILRVPMVRAPMGHAPMGRVPMVRYTIKTLHLIEQK